MKNLLLLCLLSGYAYAADSKINAHIIQVLNLKPDLPAAAQKEMSTEDFKKLNQQYQDVYCTGLKDGTEYMYKKVLPIISLSMALNGYLLVSLYRQLYS